MFHKNIGHVSCHHITHQSTAHACHYPYKYQKEPIFSKSCFYSRIASHHCKDPKADGISQKKKPLIHFMGMIPFPENLRNPAAHGAWIRRSPLFSPLFPHPPLLPFLQVNKEKYNGRGNHCRQCILRIAKHCRRIHPKNQVPDQSASGGSGHSQHIHPKKIHSPLDRYHSP